MCNTFLQRGKYESGLKKQLQKLFNSHTAVMVVKHDLSGEFDLLHFDVFI